MRILYVDASAGVSGDMLLAAMLNLGFPLQRLQRLLRRLNLGDVRIVTERVRDERAVARDRETRAIRLSVDEGSIGRILPTRAGEVIRWVEQSDLDPSIRKSITRVWTILAKAEGYVHGVPWNEVQFHQVGRPDTWVSFCGFCAGLSHFRVQSLFVNPIPVGHFHQGHGGGRCLTPGPATLRLLRNFPIVHRKDRFEWTTPTGAALLSAFGSLNPAPPFKVLGIGHGAGHGSPSPGRGFLRLLLGQTGDLPYTG